MKPNSLKEIYLTSVALAKDSQRFAKEVAKHNPGIEGNDKTSLMILSAQAGKLAWKFARLNSELMEMHEEEQRNKIL